MIADSMESPVCHRCGCEHFIRKTRGNSYRHTKENLICRHCGKKFIEASLSSRLKKSRRRKTREELDDF